MCGSFVAGNFQRVRFVYCVVASAEVMSVSVWMYVLYAEL